MPEGSVAGTRIGRLPLPPQFSPDAGATLPRFEIVAGNSDDVFRIDASSGELFVARPGLLDFELRRRYELTVRVRSGVVGTDSAQRTFAADLLASSGDLNALSALLADSAEFVAVVDVLDVDEPPTLEPQSITLVYESGDRSGAAAWLRASDPESLTALRYSVLAGNSDGQLVVDEMTGRIEIAPDRPVPPGQHVLPLTILVTDPAGNSDATTILVRVVGLRDPEPAPLLTAESGVPETAGEAEQAKGDESAVNDKPGAAAIEAAAHAVTAPVENQVAGSDGKVQDRAANRTALWYFICGVLLGAGATAFVAGRRREPQASRPASSAATPRNPLHRVRPQPILYPPPGETHVIPAVAPTPAAEIQAEPATCPVPAHVSMSALPPAENAPAPSSMVDLRAIRDWREESPAVEPAALEDTCDTASAPGYQPIEYPWPELPTTTPPQATVEAERVEAPRRDDVSWAAAAQSDAPAALGPGLDWSAGDAAAPVPAVPLVNEEPATAPEGDWPAVDLPGSSADEFAIAETLCEMDRAAHVPDHERSEFDATTADSSFPAPEHGAASAPEEAGSITPAEAAVDTPELPADAPNEEPRVLELRRQLTELFGVPADYQPPPAGDPQDLSAEGEVAMDGVESTTPAGDAAPSRGIGADVVDLLDTWRARLNAELQADGGGSPAASASEPLPDDVTADAFVLTPLTPETRLARSAAFELPPRVDKSAVRQEISSLRAVANSHARAVVARLSMETRARHVWLISGTCMVPLFSGGTYLLSTMPPGPMRWLGWLMLTGGAAAFSVCLNSFNRLSKLHEEQESLLPEDGAGGDPLRDTAEIDIPAELAADAPAAEPEGEAAEPALPTLGDAPVPAEELAAGTRA